MFPASSTDTIAPGSSSHYASAGTSPILSLSALSQGTLSGTNYIEEQLSEHLNRNTAISSVPNIQCSSSRSSRAPSTSLSNSSEPAPICRVLDHLGVVETGLPSSSTINATGCNNNANSGCSSSNNSNNTAVKVSSSSNKRPQTERPPPPPRFVYWHIIHLVYHSYCHLFMNL